jgi:hypothetical protein
LPGFLFFFVVFLVLVVVFVGLGVFVKLFIFKDFVFVVVFDRAGMHGSLPGLFGCGFRSCSRCSWCRRRGGCGAGLRGIRRPIVAAAFLADPELIRLPRGSRRRIPEIHLIAATLAANLHAHIAHATIL